jgi:hypothetical protein
MTLIIDGKQKMIGCMHGIDFECSSVESADQMTRFGFRVGQRPIMNSGKHPGRNVVVHVPVVHYCHGTDARDDWGICTTVGRCTVVETADQNDAIRFEVGK